MLSEVIHSQLSYSAVPLAGQQIDQRLVHSGPLVTFLSNTKGETGIYPLFLGV